MSGMAQAAMTVGIATILAVLAIMAADGHKGAVWAY